MNLKSGAQKYKNKVNREKVAVLHRKLDSIGAQKGIMISTGGYQSGAIEYAKEHGIALIIVKDYHFEFLSHSSDPNIVNENDPFLYAEIACKFCIKESQSDPSAEKARFIAPAARNREGKTVVKGFLYSERYIIWIYLFLSVYEGVISSSQTVLCPSSSETGVKPIRL